MKIEWIDALKTMGNKKYWNKPNTVEFWAFATKLSIIFPGLLFGNNGGGYTFLH